MWSIMIYFLSAEDRGRIRSELVRTWRKRVAQKGSLEKRFKKLWKRYWQIENKVLYYKSCRTTKRTTGEVEERRGNGSEKQIAKKFEKLLKKYLTNKTRCAILTRLPQRAVARTVLKNWTTREYKANWNNLWRNLVNSYRGNTTHKE